MSYDSVCASVSVNLYLAHIEIFNGLRELSVPAERDAAAVRAGGRSSVGMCLDLGEDKSYSWHRRELLWLWSSTQSHIRIPAILSSRQLRDGYKDIRLYIMPALKWAIQTKDGVSMRQMYAAAAYSCRSLGSQRSRSQSPMKLNASTVRNIAMPGKNATHHAEPR